MADEIQKTPVSEEQLAARIDIIKGLIVAKKFSQRSVVRYCLKHYPEWDYTDRWLRKLYKRGEIELKQELQGVDTSLWIYKELLFQGELAREAKSKGNLGIALEASNSTLRWLERFGATISPSTEQKALQQGVNMENLYTQLGDYIEVNVDEVQPATQPTT